MAAAGAGAAAFGPGASAAGGYDDLPSLFAALMSNDNNRRRHAESVYFALAEAGAQILPMLVGALRTTPEAVLRAMGAVLLRKVLAREDDKGARVAWADLDVDGQAQFKAALLEILLAEPEASVQRKLCHACAELASACGDAGWPEAVPFAVALAGGEASGTDPRRREVGLFLLTKLAEYVGPPMKAFAGDCLPVVQAAFEDTVSSVRVSALKAMVGLLLCFEGVDELTPFLDVLPQLFMVLQASTKEDELDAREALQSLADIAHHEPTFLRPFLDPAGVAMLTIAQDGALEDDTRELALEFLLELASSGGGMVRKSDVIGSGIVNLAVALICDAEEDPDWDNKENNANFYTGEATDSDLATVAHAAVDRISKALGGRVMMPLVEAAVGPLFADADWRRRRCGVLVVALAADGCGAVMKAKLTEVVGILLPLLDDAHPRVRFAAVHALGQLALDFGKRVKKQRNFQDLVGPSVLPALVKSMGEHNAAHPRVRGHACLSLVNFSESGSCKPAHLEPVGEVLGAVFGVLRDGLRDGRRQQLEQGIVAVSAVANVIGERFAEFYDDFVATARSIVEGVAGPEYAELRGQALELVAAMGEFVGPERFAPDAEAVMSAVMGSAGEHGLSISGNAARHVHKAAARVAKVMGPGFVPYLEHVMPPLLAAAAADTTVLMTDAEEGDDGALEGLDTMLLEVRGMGSKKVGMDSALMEDKATACFMLYQYVDELNDCGFLPYLDRTVATCAPLLRYPYLEGPRTAAICMLPRFVACALTDPADAGHAQRVLMELLPPLCEALRKERAMDVLATLGEAFQEVMRECFESGPPPVAGVPPEQLQEVYEASTACMRRCAQRRHEAMEAASTDPDFDEESAEALEAQLEQEQEVMTGVQDAMGYIVKMYKGMVIPVMRDSGCEELVWQMAASSDEVGVACAVCMLDDLFEFAAEAAVGYLEPFSKLLESGMQSADNTLRQAAVYGAGVLFEHGGAAAEPALPMLVKGLLQVVQAEGSFDEENVNVSENAVSALLKACMHRRGSLGEQAQGVMDLCLSHLPFTADELEATVVHEAFVALALAEDPLVVGEAWSRLPQVLHVLTLVVGTHFEAAEAGDDLMSEETLAKCPELWARVRALPAEAVAAATEGLSEEQNAVLGMLSEAL